MLTWHTWYSRDGWTLVVNTRGDFKDLIYTSDNCVWCTLPFSADQEWDIMKRAKLCSGRLVNFPHPLTSDIKKKLSQQNYSIFTARPVNKARSQSICCYTSGKQPLYCVNTDRKLPGCGCNSPRVLWKTHTNMRRGHKKHCTNTPTPIIEQEVQEDDQLKISAPFRFSVDSLCVNAGTQTHTRTPPLFSFGLQQSDMSSTYLSHFTFTWLIFSPRLSFHL